MIKDKYFNSLINSLSKIDCVDAILLAGSRTSNSIDESSDYDIYVYVNEEIPLHIRESILKENLSYYELNNTLWETEDQGFLKITEIQIDIVYRNIEWLNDHLEKLLNKFIVSTGYSTCLWSNLIQSKILFDRNGKAKFLKEKFDIPYSDDLVKAIINKNHGVLRTIIPSYIHQIEKAIKRNDYVSIQHRLTAFLESYFDIVFAINKLKHTGEKKILYILKDKAKYLPRNMEEQIVLLLRNQYNNNSNILSQIQNICNNLDQLLIEKGILSKNQTH